MKKIRIGGGAGFAGDRVDAAVVLIEKGNLDYIIFECLAERTIGLAKQEMLKDPTKGYSRLLEYRMSQVLKPAKEHGVKIITNMGAVNPHAAVMKVMEIAEEQGITGLKFAAVTGDSIDDSIEQYYDEEILEFKGKVADWKDQIVSANVYMGAEGIIEALRNGADVIITGRVADPTLTLAPLRYEYGWTPDDADKICLCMRQMQKQSADICRKVFQCVCPISLSHTKCIEIYHGWPDMGIMLQHLMYRLLIAAQMMK